MVVSFRFFIFTAKLGEMISHFDYSNIFQMGWFNHQLEGPFSNMYLEPATSVYKWLFQLDDSKSLHKKWLFHHFHPFKPGCLGYQVVHGEESSFTSRPGRSFFGRWSLATRIPVETAWMENGRLLKGLLLDLYLENIGK